MRRDAHRAPEAAGKALKGPTVPRVVRADFVAEARSAAQVPAPVLPEVALAGRSNVGKSTLVNALAGRKNLARTSRTPGCTRGVIFYELGLDDGTRLSLVDLPGYGFADRAREERVSWKTLIEGYLTERPTLRGLAILVDARRGPEDEERQLAEYLGVLGQPFVLVATKVDKVAKNERFRALSSLSLPGALRSPLAVSGETGEGRDALLSTLLRMALPGPTAPQGTPGT